MGYTLLSTYTCRPHELTARLFYLYKLTAYTQKLSTHSLDTYTSERISDGISRILHICMCYVYAFQYVHGCQSVVSKNRTVYTQPSIILTRLNSNHWQTNTKPPTTHNSPQMWHKDYRAARLVNGDIRMCGLANCEEQPNG